MIILKVTKSQGFTLSLEDAFFEKPPGGRIPPPPSPQPFRVKFLLIFLPIFLPILLAKDKNP